MNINLTLRIFEIFIINKLTGINIKTINDSFLYKKSPL